MNKTLTLAVGALIALASYAAPALAEVDVSISVGQPGFYGRIDLGDAPRPRVYYRQPRLVERVAVEQEPIYLHVRPGQSRNWRKHCRSYNACGRRVYFVNHNWYDTVYVPHYRERGDRDRGRHGNRGDGHDGRDHDDGHRYGDRRDDDRREHGDNHRDDGRRRDDARRDDDRRDDRHDNN